MNYICPICLESLSNQMLRYVCTTNQHCVEQGIKNVSVQVGEVPSISCSMCSAAIHVPPANLVSGIYVLHEGCRFHNPYWSVDAGDNVAVGIPNLLPQITAMQDIRGISPHDREMWFPLSLLQACERTYNSGRKHGALIVLTGAPGAGKSSLATMMMSARGWLDAEPGAFNVEEISEFVYEPPTAGDHPQRAFEEWIKLVADLNHDVTEWPPQTDPERFPLIRATFVLRAPTLQASQEASSGLWPRLSKGVRDATRGIFGARNRSVAIKFPVVFYDNAGELLRNPRRDYLESLKIADAIVVVIDPTTPDFPPAQATGRSNGAPNIIGAIPGGAGASDHLRRRALVDTRQLLRDVAAFIDGIGDAGVATPTLHIVVTKCDAYYAGQPHELRRIETESAAESRARLVRILQRSTDNLIRSANGLRGIIESEGLVKSVRFTWIADLPMTGRHARPEARNLAKVVSDCIADLLPRAED